MKTFVEKFVCEEKRIDLDVMYPFYDNEERNEVMTTNKINYASVPSIDIGEMINLLMAMRDKGANRVYIADHCDHHGYYFYGVELKEV